jgi:pancreatic triacylglycerol lipase
MNSTNLLESGFDPEKPIKFVIHGFIDTGFSSWVVKLSQQLTTVGDYNVFAVDWGGGSLPLYTQATANTRVVGLEVAHFIKFLMVWAWAGCLHS